MKGQGVPFHGAEAADNKCFHRQEPQVLYIHTSQDYRSLDARKIPWQRLQLCDGQLTELCGLRLEEGRAMNRRASQEAPFPESTELTTW